MFPFNKDISIAIETIKKGSKIVIDEAKKISDENVCDTKVTMKVIQEISNKINPMIKLTVDTPCDHENGKLPVLDVQVNVNQNEDNRIDFEFFQKPTKNPFVILANSALSHPQKRTILTQECLRRLRNTKVELGPDVQRKHLTNFMLTMKNSGYPEKFRREILDSTMKAFDKMVSEDTNNVKPLYRSKSWNSEARSMSKLVKKRNWWNSEKSCIQYKSVLFVTPTPGGSWLRMYRGGKQK